MAENGCHKCEISFKKMCLNMFEEEYDPKLNMVGN